MRYLIAAAAVVLIAAQPLPGAWTSGPPMPMACSEVAVATAGNTMYVIGGYANGSVDQSSVLAFHPVLQNGRITGTWRAVSIFCISSSTPNPSISGIIKSNKTRFG